MLNDVCKNGSSPLLESSQQSAAAVSKYLRRTILTGMMRTMIRMMMMMMVRMMMMVMTNLLNYVLEATLVDKAD